MNKSKYTQIIRHIFQFMSFILFPGFFIIILNSISGIYQSLISGSFSLSAQGSNIFTIITVSMITFFWGRFFCGYLCAFGSMQEGISFLARKLKIRQWNIPPVADRIMKKMKYVILLLLFLAWTLKITLDPVNPWYVFGVYSSYKGWSSLSTAFSIGGVILFFIIMVALFCERFFCRYFCPLGGIFSIISIPRVFKIRRNQKTCVNCNLCSEACPMGISVLHESTQNERVTSGECIDCLRCTKSCPADALKTNSQEALSGTVAALVMTGIYYVGTIPTSSYAKDNTDSYIESTDSSADSVSEIQGKYKDGTYTGTGKGFRGDTDVSVTVENGMISMITVNSYEDDTKFFEKAQSTVIDEIITAQSTDVDAVSGATYSSEGIISAVENALSNAGSVEIEEVEDASEENTSSSEDAPYLSRAEGVIDSVISSQSVNVDTISGATMSSNGILEAIADALNLSYTNTNSQINNHHGHGGHRGK